VVTFLQEENLPFLMPVVIRGRDPKKGRKAIRHRDQLPADATGAHLHLHARSSIRRKLSTASIAKLAAYFHVSPAALLEEATS
jgi:hypothetical protein